jgi:hypothetical protein
MKLYLQVTGESGVAQLKRSAIIVTASDRKLGGRHLGGASRTLAFSKTSIATRNGAT